VFLNYRNPVDIHGTRPDGIPTPEPVKPALYLPSPTGPDIKSVPPNLYIPLADLAVLQAGIIAAMINGTFLTVKIVAGEVVVNGAGLAFAVLCVPNPAVAAGA